MELKQEGSDTLILQQALHALRRACGTHTIEDLNSIFEPAVTSLGFTAFACALVSDDNVSAGLKLLFGKGLDQWQRRYSDMRYHRYDPIIHECRRHSNAFYWSELRLTQMLSEGEVQVLDDARSFGIDEAFVEPIHKSDSSVLIVLFATNQRHQPNLELRAATHMLAAYYGLRGAMLYRGETGYRDSHRHLTYRQLECLQWVRAGKSSTDIAEILDISSGVVDEHIANACRRLGVGTRIQAVIAASDLGYLAQ